MDFEEKYKDFKQIPLNQNFNYPPGEARGSEDWNTKFTPLWVLEINRKREDENRDNNQKQNSHCGDTESSPVAGQHQSDRTDD